MVRITRRTGSQFDVQETLYWIADTLANKRGEGYFTLRKVDGLKVVLYVGEIESAEEVFGAAMDVPQGVDPPAHEFISVDEFDASQRATQANKAAVV